MQGLIRGGADLASLTAIGEDIAKKIKTIVETGSITASMFCYI
ncbi:MAG: hypothetical protein OQL05_04415 [Gammaproteobacteria bacterium]|nr:hypothetical protein [Gammaproteobacteria bacterium]MCW8992144.1 hypothetical protein [Gammaproteobacteria bacterium]